LGGQEHAVFPARCVTSVVDEILKMLRENSLENELILVTGTVRHVIAVLLEDSESSYVGHHSIDSLLGLDEVGRVSGCAV